MNIFIIPSWYPSENQPFTGIFFRRMAMLYSRNFEIDNIGISVWGQNDENLLLWSNQVFSSFRKITSFQKRETKKSPLLKNCNEYFTPSLTWTRKWKEGNIQGILNANLKNLEAFERDFGKVDLIHCHIAYPSGYIAVQLKEKLKTPFIITENQSPFPFESFKNKKGGLIRQLSKAYSESASNVAVSNFMKLTMEKFNISKIDVLPNFVDENLFEQTPINQIEPAILFVGRLEEQKAPDVLFQALRLTQRKNLLVKIVGEGSMKDSLKRQKLEHQIQFLGTRTELEIAELMKSSTMLVLPSRHEGLPFVIIEALACGLPVITTNCGGPEEMISEEVGLVVEKENPKELAEAIDKVVEYPNFDKKKVREHFLKNYSSKKVTEEIRALYTRCVSQ